ncbi:MAG: DNA polymerase Y family protein [Gammaproteobacteria bacterium]|nr:DNA polymerase Y family protein [Gammaproteobacteria bacterium]
MLWLAVHLPMFALEVSQAGQHAQAPAVLIDANRVLLGNRAALQAGIGLQGTLATAHGICPGLVHYRRNPGRELKRLQLLAGMCYRFTSRVSLEPPGDGQTASALLLEASGSLRLFGPMDAWQSRVEALCRDLGHASVLRAAETPSAALALARAGVSRLPDVPLFHTGLAEAEVESLANMGISTLGPLLQLPQAELGQRFGAGLTNYLQRLAGAAPDPRRCIEPEPVFASSLNLLDPITDKSALLFPMQRLLTELEHWLIGRQLGAARLLWRFAPHEAAAGVSMPVRFAAARQRKAAFMEVVRLALNKTELPENVLEIGLKAKSLAPWTTRSRELFELPLQQKSVVDPPSQQKQTAPTELIDRFTAHLGEAGCSGITATGQHVPEWAWRSLQPGSARGHPSHKKTQPGSARGHPSHKKTQPGSAEPSAGEREGIPLACKEHPSHAKSRTGETGDSPDSPAGINRPLWFFDPPRRIDRQSFEILSGPERLQTGWWEAAEPFSAGGAPSRSPAEGSRDYYVIRCGNGARGWAFVQPDGNWFLHGYFG